MINRFCKWLALVAFAGLTGLSAPGPAISAEACFDDWSAAAAAVKQHKLVPVAELGAVAKRRGDGQLVRTELCKSGNGYVYKVVLRDKSGRLTRRTVSAKRPFALGSATQ